MRGGRRRAEGAAAAVVALMVLLAGLTPVPPAGAQPAEDVPVVELDGLDDLVLGVPSPVRVTIRVPAGSGLLPDSPLRLLGTIDPWDAEDGGVAVALATSGEPVDLPVDDAGRFVLPSAEGAPLTLAGTPALASAEGHTLTLLVTAEDDEEREISLALTASNERGAAVVRRAGPERTATAAAVSAASFAPGVGVAYVARADAFPDALAAGPVAGLAGGPILLTHRDTLPAATRTELERLDPARIVVLGGAAAVGEAVLRQLDDLAEEGAERVAGADRFGTAAAIALAAYDGPIGTVYVATGTNFADALAGGPAAAMADAPLLLVTRDTIPAATERALRALDPDRIVVLGGSAAVGDAVVGRLGALARDGATRHAGADRFATSAAVSARTFEAGGVTSAYLATGMNFPDSLAGAPAAIRDEAPLLLVTRDAIPAPVAAELRRLRPGVVVLLGGTGVVGDAVAAAAARLTRTIEPDPDRFRMLGQAATGVLAAAGELEVAPLDPEGPVGMRPGQRFVLEVTAPRQGAYVVEHRPAGGGAWVPLRNVTASGELEPGVHDIPLNAPADLGAFDLRFRWIRPSATQEVVLANALTTSVPFRPPLFSSLMEAVDGQTQVVAVSPVGGLEEGVQLDADLSDAVLAGVDYSGATLVQTHGSGSSRLVLDRPADLDTGVSSCRVCIEYTAGPGDAHTEGAPARPVPIIAFRLEGIDAPDLHETFVGRFFRYDLMHGVRWTFTVGDGGAVASPQISDLEQGNPHQAQFVSFALPGRDNATALQPFESVVIDLSEAERGAVDYADAFAFVEGGGHESAPEHEPPPGLGTAFLEVVEGEEAYLVFTAGPEGVAGVSPEGPLIEIFVGGVATDDEAGIYAADVTRTDADGVSTTSFAVRRVGLEDATATDLAAGEADQDQTLAVTLEGELEPGALVIIDLTGASVGGVDYRGAAVEVSGGTGTASLLTFDEEGAEGAAIAYATGAGDEDGARLVFEVTGVATEMVDETHAAWFFRTDISSEAVALFDVGAGSPFASPAVSDLEAGMDDTHQSASFALTDDLQPGQAVAIDLSSAEVGGASYGGANAFAWDESGGEHPVELEVVDGVSAVLRYTAAEAVPAGTLVGIELAGVATEEAEESHTAVFARDGDDRTATRRFAIRAVPTLRAVSATDLEPDAIGVTQTLRATVVQDLLPGEEIRVDLSTAERGAAAYGGARLSINPEASGTVRLEVFRGEYAQLVYVAGPEGDPDGTELAFTLAGVNTDPGDETHAADFTREGELTYSTRTALFDIGAGGPFIGQPQVSDVFVGEEWQWLDVRLTAALAPGETVTFDLSQAQAGGVDYREAFPAWVSGNGTATLQADATSAAVTFTAGPAGVPAGRPISLELAGIRVEDREGVHTVTVTAPGAQTTTTFQVWTGGHGDAAAGTAAPSPASAFVERLLRR